MANSKELKFTNALQDGWNALTTKQRRIAGALGAIDTAAKGAAMFDLARADAKQVRGPKWAWGIAIPAINTFGWLAYFIAGRKRG